MKVLFICKGNWFRSQMAAGIYNKLTNSTDADSVGTYVGAVDEPEGLVISNVMQEPFFKELESHGIFIRQNKTKRLTPEMLDTYETIISMAQEPYIPDFLKNNKKVIRWNVEDTDGVTKEVAEKTYKQLDGLIQHLIK